jgi:hypothetical protein
MGQMEKQSRILTMRPIMVPQAHTPTIGIGREYRNASHLAL